MHGPLGKPARVVRSQEGVEVGRIVEEGAQVDVKLLDEATGQILLDRGEGPFVQVLHMIPKALTAQCGSTQREQPAKNSAAVPGGEFAFAGGRNSPVDRRQEDILADRRSLSPLRRVAVNRSDDVELLRDVPQSRCGTEVPFLGIQRAAWGLREESEEFLGGAEVAEDPDARAAVGVAIRFDDTPVAVAADCVGLEAGHGSYIPHPVPPVNRAVICSGMRARTMALPQPAGMLWPSGVSRSGCT